MVMTSEGLNRIRDLMNADVTTGTLGTGTNAANITDTDLQTGDAASAISTTNTVADRQLVTQYTLPSTSGTTGTYTEYKNHSGSTDFDRIVFTGISFTKNGVEEIAVVKKYFFRGT